MTGPRTLHTWRIMALKAVRSLSKKTEILGHPFHEWISYCIFKYWLVSLFLPVLTFPFLRILTCISLLVLTRTSLQILISLTLFSYESNLLLHCDYITDFYIVDTLFVRLIHLLVSKATDY